MEHIAIAERFKASPYEVLYVWPVELVDECRAVMRAEARYDKRHPKG